MDSQAFRAVESFSCPRYDGEPGDQIVFTGTIVMGGDKILVGREHFFEPVDAAVERATARPGEKRLTKRAPHVV